MKTVLNTFLYYEQWFLMGSGIIPWYLCGSAELKYFRLCLRTSSSDIKVNLGLKENIQDLVILSWDRWITKWGSGHFQPQNKKKNIKNKLELYFD